MFVAQLSILVVSDHPEFANSLVRNWQNPPRFTVLAVGQSAEIPECVVAVLDGPAGLSRLRKDVLLAIVITGNEPLSRVGCAAKRVVQIRRIAGWTEQAAALAEETVRRTEAEERAQRAEQGLLEAQRYIALGRFIDDSRHGLGNALTGVLGNSELVLLNAGSGLQDGAREQVKTIHAMSLKIYEIVQRLSSLDMEMQLMQRHVDPERQVPLRAARGAASQ
jgi:signal transduction histidine kinase